MAETARQLLPYRIYEAELLYIQDKGRDCLILAWVNRRVRKMSRLIATEIPAHNHPLSVANTPADKTDPTNNSIAGVADVTENAMPSYKTADPTAALNPLSVGQSGGNQPHNNRPPYLGMNYIICMFGIFPSRN